MAAGEYRLVIETQFDATRAALQARRCAHDEGFDSTKTAMLVTSVSELCTNILKYAGSGQLILQPLRRSGRNGLLIRAVDQGPGIDDIDAALQDHRSTGGTLGLGLPGVKRMMDEFELQSVPGQGTTVTVKKWT